jgi:trk system potassium uptake protein
VRAVVIGCGRVGSTLARRLRDEGWTVCAIDQNEDALARLGEDWLGEFVVGHGMDADVLERGGIAHADAVIVATNGDNTNLVAAQVAKQGYGVPHVAVRIADPARADVYAGHGFTVISPTKIAIEALTAWAQQTQGRV